MGRLLVPQPFLIYKWILTFTKKIIDNYFFGTNNVSVRKIGKSISKMIDFFIVKKYYLIWILPSQQILAGQ